MAVGAAIPVQHLPSLTRGPGATVSTLLPRAVMVEGGTSVAQPPGNVVVVPDACLLGPDKIYTAPESAGSAIGPQRGQE